MCTFILIIGRDAIRPFIVEEPNEIYDKSDINVDAMFTLAESVCKQYALWYIALWHKAFRNFYF